LIYKKDQTHEEREKFFTIGQMQEEMRLIDPAKI